MKKIVKKTMMLMLAMIITAGIAIPASAKEEISDANVRNYIFKEINNFRIENGLLPFSYGEYETGSNIRAKESKSFWSHTRPDGTDYWTVDNRIFGENLARLYTYQYKDCVKNWINSPVHRDLLLADDFESCCIGVHEAKVDSEEWFFITCEFGY